MQSDQCLKRSKFANSIRLQQRQRIKKQIRDRYNLTNSEYTGKEQQMASYGQSGRQYDEEEFRKYRQECRGWGFQRAKVEAALGYLWSRDIWGVGQEVNVKFLGEVTEKLQASDQPADQAILEQIKTKLQQIINFQIQKSPKDQKSNLLPTKQLSQLHILKYCFDSFLALLKIYPAYTELWLSFSLLRNHSLKSYSFPIFQSHIAENLDSLSSQHITIIAFTLENFVEDVPDEYVNFLNIIDRIFGGYLVQPKDAGRLVGVLLELVAGGLLEHKIKVLVEQTEVYQCVAGFLNKGAMQGMVDFQLVAKAAAFVARIFSIQRPQDPELYLKIYPKYIMILQDIRSWLPIPPNITPPMLDHPNSPSLLHSNHRTTLHLLYCLSNIAATDGPFLQTLLLRSDIYRALTYLYKLVPLSCREEIAYFVYNAVYKADVGLLRVMIDFRLVELVGEMLREDSGVCVGKGLGIVGIVWRELGEQGGNGSQGYNVNIGGNLGSKSKSNLFDGKTTFSAINTGSWLYSRKKFQIALENLGCIKSIESLVNWPEEQISKLAITALELFT